MDNADPRSQAQCSEVRDQVWAFRAAQASGGLSGLREALAPSDQLPVKWLPPGCKKDYWWCYLGEGGVGSYKTFRRVWHDCFAKILRLRSFGHHACCTECTRLKQRIHTAASLTHKVAATKAYAEHLASQWRDRQTYWRLRAASHRTGSGWLTMIVDGADQAKFRVMRATVWPKNLEGEPRPVMKVVGALLHGYEMSFSFLEEDVPKGSNVTLEVLVGSLERAMASQPLVAGDAPPPLLASSRQRRWRKQEPTHSQILIIVGGPRCLPHLHPLVLAGGPHP